MLRVRKKPSEMFARSGSCSESSDDYFDLVAVLNSEWRVIACRDLLNWALQRRISPKSAPGDSRRAPDRPQGWHSKYESPPGENWRGVVYCRTRDALRRAVRERAGTVDPHAAIALVRLPPSINAPGKPRKDDACPLHRLHAKLQRAAGEQAVCKASARPADAAARDWDAETRPAGADEWATAAASAEGRRAIEARDRESVA
jgi:hypothetical protein